MCMYMLQPRTCKLVACLFPSNHVCFSQTRAIPCLFGCTCVSLLAASPRCCPMRLECSPCPLRATRLVHQPSCPALLRATDRSCPACLYAAMRLLLHCGRRPRQASTLASSSLFPVAPPSSHSATTGPSFRTHTKLDALSRTGVEPFGLRPCILRCRA